MDQTLENVIRKATEAKEAFHLAAEECVKRAAIKTQAFNSLTVALNDVRLALKQRGIEL